MIEINNKNKLYGWANKNGKALEFETLEEKFENGRRLFTIGATVDGELCCEGLVKFMIQMPGKTAKIDAPDTKAAPETKGS